MKLNRTVSLRKLVVSIAPIIPASIEEPVLVRGSVMVMDVRKECVRETAKVATPSAQCLSRRSVQDSLLLLMFVMAVGV